MPSILITGANRGIGLAFTRHYAGAGWRVHACCRQPDQAAALEAVGGDVAIHPLDVGDGASVTALAGALGGAPLDVLLNNAGVYLDKGGKLGAIDYEAWAKTLAVNTLAPIRVAEALLDNVAASGRRLIVCISSQMGSIADNSSGGAYAYRSSKAALNAAVKSFALDAAGRGVAAVVFHPGWVSTDMGGASAPIDAEQSVAGMTTVIERLGIADSGRFFNRDGRELPW